MDIKECYGLLGGNYEDVLGRFQKESLVERFLIKFISDPSMDSLKLAVSEGNIEESFLAAHTLKGVAGNLAITGLAEAAGELTEQLRSRQNSADELLFKKLNEEYLRVMDIINSFKTQNE